MTDSEFNRILTECDPKPETVRAIRCSKCGGALGTLAMDGGPLVMKGLCDCRVDAEKPAETGSRELPGMAVGFFVPGQPVGKGRPIAGRDFGGRTTLRTPEKTVAYEGLVAHACHSAMKGMSPFSGPLALDLSIGVQIPASWSKKRQQAAGDGLVAPTKKPDADNVVKALCDGMNGIAYGDDSQIVRISVIKRYSAIPGVIVMVRVLDLEAA